MKTARVGTLRLAELRPLMRFPQFVACSRLHGRKKFLFPPFRRTKFLLRKKRFDYPLSHRAKRDIGCEGGYAAPRRIATADAVPEKIAHSRLRSRFLRCKNRCFGEPSFCCAKNGSIIRSRPKHKQTIEKMELIKTISSRVGTLRLAELRPLMRFPQFVACSRLHGRKKFLFPPFRRTMFFCCAKKTVRLSALAPNINRHPFGCLKDENGEGGYAAPRRIATADAVPAIRCLLATSRSEKVSFSAVSANHVFLLRKKNGSIIHPAPNKNRPSKRWSVFVWWARVDSDHRS